MRGRAWWPIAIYPSAFPLAMVILVWGQAEISVMELIRPAVVAIVASLIVTLVCSLLAGDRRYGGIAASAIAVALVVTRMEAILVLLLVGGVVLVLARLPGARDVRPLSLITRLLEGVAVIAVVAAVLASVQEPGFVPDLEEAFIAPPGPAERPMPPAGSPDIFVYLIDGYPGRTAASQAPWFDASAFPSALAQRGFTVHDDSRSNYLLTRLVIPTMFESKYVEDIPGLAAPLGPDQAVDARRLRETLETSSGLANIRAAGYDVMWVSSGWSHLDIRNVDRRIEAPGPSELEVAILRQSGAGTLLQLLDPTGFSRVMRDRIHAAYASATALAAEPHTRPRFVFVHVPSPHPPTVFQADGSPENGSPDAAWDTNVVPGETKDVRRQRVFEQVEAAANLTVQGVDAMRQVSATPPVIAVFSDHGTDISFDATVPIGSDTNERSSNFLATLTPGHPDLFREPTMPINIISTITNAYLGTSVPRQPDHTYAYKGSVLNTVPIETTPGD
jgi:hypothetical protein